MAADDVLRRRLLVDPSILRDAADEVLLRRWAASQDVNNSDAELQQAADEMRYQRGLESVERLAAWLAERHQTLLSLQQGLDYRLLRHKVRQSITEEEIEEFLVEHQSEFEKVELWLIVVSDEDLAEELRAQVIEEGVDFHALAREHSEDEATAPAGGWLGRLRRDELGPDVEAAVFHRKPGEIVGPVPGPDGQRLFKVGRKLVPQLEQERDSIRLRLFRRLLERLRAEARLEYPFLDD